MKVACLVSGGVDSSVALALLKEQGHDVTAFYLKIWLEDELSYLGTCPWQEDLTYVQSVCTQLSVPLQVINLQKEYFEHVVKYALRQVELGNTPNPDMLCNEFVKFGVFWQAIKGFDAVATGHYAWATNINGVSYLCRVPDQIKDQTYFLARLSQEQVSKALFPIGRMLKSEVRAHAKRLGLTTHTRADSQGICFLGKLKYTDFLAHYFPQKKGDFIDIATGNVLGHHQGHYFHTVGQRKGTGLGKGPWFVVKKDVALNRVYLSNTPPTLQKHVFVVGDVHWISGEPKKTSLKLKLRHGERVYSCTIKSHPNGLEVSLMAKDAWIAPGQFAVFYDDIYCYGCGVVLP